MSSISETIEEREARVAALGRRADELGAVVADVARTLGVQAHDHGEIKERVAELARHALTCAAWRQEGSTPIVSEASGVMCDGGELKEARARLACARMLRLLSSLMLLALGWLLAKVVMAIFG